MSPLDDVGYLYYQRQHQCKICMHVKLQESLQGHQVGTMSITGVSLSWPHDTEKVHQGVPPSQNHPSLPAPKHSTQTSYQVNHFS